MSQTAVEMDEIKFSVILPHDIFKVWKDIKKYLERSCKRSNGRHTVDTIYKQLIDGQAHLWIVFDPENDLITGCIVTNHVYYPTGLKMLNILQLCGKNMQDWMETGKPILLDWAKKNECNGVEALGREGMSNWLTDKDTKWKKNNLLFEMQFDRQ